MPGDTLGLKERSGLLALMAAAGVASNPELERVTGFRLHGTELEKLRARRLVDSHREASLPGRPLVHRLTADGWDWCTAELAADRPPRAGSAGGALYAVLAGLQRYLTRSHLALPDVFRPDGETPAAAPRPQEPPQEAPQEPPQALDLPGRIRAAYRKLARDPQDLVSLTQLRPLLGAAPRDEVDAALRRMSRARQANLVPQANQKTLSQADRAAAVRIGNEDCHLVSIEGS